MDRRSFLTTGALTAGLAAMPKIAAERELTNLAPQHVRLQVIQDGIPLPSIRIQERFCA